MGIQVGDFGDIGGPDLLPVIDRPESPVGQHQKRLRHRLDVRHRTGPGLQPPRPGRGTQERPDVEHHPHGTRGHVRGPGRDERGKSGGPDGPSSLSALTE